MYNIKVKIFCNKCAQIFEQTPASHLAGKGCPNCTFSKGEERIIKWLKQNNINFIHQYKFKDCINPITDYPLRFDFYLPEYNICIEYDGEQHYKPHSWSSDKSKNKMIQNLELVKNRDSIKTQYCINKNINLIRIPYTKIKLINNILNSIIGI